ncbi:hypothetical protein FCH28_08450 [Streptomyces piniterrae]|uniref:Lipoprotein n=1 Tax=Streptomyces piniterrae TaxID=2571125 RepID=A0A4U0NU37_9ACTN|nr:hypothetical protein FCH28_08450 [Streptomyces piniterrae]
MRMRKGVVPALALVVVAVAATGCFSSEGGDEQRLTGLRENYCLKLGAWQKARNAAGTITPESSAHEKAGLAAQEASLAMQPLRDESVSGGRTLGEETGWAINDGDSEAEARVVQYCDDAGFETLTR